MHTSPARFTRHGLAAAALVLALPAWSQTFTPDGYQQERAACAAMSNPEARSNCLRDLGAARQQQRSQPRPRVSADELQRNAVRRCEAHKDMDARAVCERMARGEGNVSGSVSGGGQIRSLESIDRSATPAPPPMGSPSMPPPGAMPPPSAMPPANPPPSTLPPLSTPPSTVPPAPMPPVTPAPPVSPPMAPPGAMPRS